MKTKPPIVATVSPRTDSGLTSRKFLPSWVHLPLIIGAVLMVVPLLWMITTSLKAPNEVFAVPTTLMPKSPELQSYMNAFSELGMGRALINSIIVTVPVAVGAVITSSMAGFAFARLQFSGKTVLFFAILGTMMIPIQVRIIPQYIGFAEIGLLNTFWPLILPGVFNSAFGVFLMRQYFTTFPRELDEAAELDGANPWKFFWFILLPQCKAPMGALALFTFLGTWNDFFSPLIFLTDSRLFTVPVAIASAVGLYGTDWPLLMAGSCVAIVPTIAVFVILRRYIVAGVTFGGAIK